MDKPESKAQTAVAQHAAFRGNGPARYRILVGKQLSPSRFSFHDQKLTLIDSPCRVSVPVKIEQRQRRYNEEKPHEENKNFSAVDLCAD